MLRALVTYALLVAGQVSNDLLLGVTGVFFNAAGENVLHPCIRRKLVLVQVASTMMPREVLPLLMSQVIFLVLSVTSLWPTWTLAVEEVRVTPVTVLLVLDGFRHDYLELFEGGVPNLLKLKLNGTYVKKVRPVFPASRYPNLATLVTGVYTENHDVLDDEVFDRELGENIYKDQAVFWKKARQAGTIWVRTNLMLHSVIIIKDTPNTILVTLCHQHS